MDESMQAFPGMYQSANFASQDGRYPIPGMTMRQYYKAKMASESFADILTHFRNRNKEVSLDELKGYLTDMIYVSSFAADLLIKDDEAFEKESEEKS